MVSVKAKPSVEFNYNFTDLPANNSTQTFSFVHNLNSRSVRVVSLWRDPAWVADQWSIMQLYDARGSYAAGGPTMLADRNQVQITLYTITTNPGAPLNGRIIVTEIV